MAVTIKDIAVEMGITPSSVSKALNEKSDVSTDLKRKVRQVAQEMGYKKNMLAVRLVTMKSNTLGVFIFSRTKIRNSESTAYKYLNIMLNEAKKYGYDIVLFSIESSLSENKSYIDLCRERQVEGALFIGFENNDYHLEELVHSGLPVVMIEKNISSENTGCVMVDNAGGISLGMNYLFTLGHEKIAFIKGHFAAELSEIRFSQYRKMMEEKNIYSDRLVFEGDFSLESGYAVGLRISEMPELPDAVFASNDLMAIGVIRAFSEKGIKIPDDISLIGFDNFEIGKYVQPKLTTIAQNFSDIAESAVTMIFNMINSGLHGRSVLLDPELIVRESCAINKKYTD
ncbi:MAG: LacI family DNA-binding transcriptional regulator [Spirochaetes bacterium]|nr:LacI family DNA-binding transcriptional regulator [Spirochaetota bacterium]